MNYQIDLVLAFFFFIEDIPNSSFDIISNFDQSIPSEHRLYICQSIFISFKRSLNLSQIGKNIHS